MIKVGYSVIFATIAIAYVLAGCANTVEKTYYENGQLKSTKTEKGFDPKWSDGMNKQLPLSNISVNGVGGNAGGIVK